jgi:glyoxylase-like metal-dependent hydrolase (beta-lactamase superfamily II)
LHLRYTLSRLVLQEMRVAIKQLLPGLYAIGLGTVNTFLIDDGGALTLIDTGMSGSEKPILAAIGEIGRAPRDVRNILVTHCHPDHAGGLAALKEATGAEAWMHPADAALVRVGSASRPAKVAPGLLNSILYRMFIGSAPGTVAPVSVEHEVVDGDEIPLAGGLRAIHAPGHCAGQVAMLWPRHGGVLFAADTCSNMVGLAYSVIYEDFELGKRSLRRRGEEAFANAVFGHGRPIIGGASERWRRKWGA